MTLTNTFQVTLSRSESWTPPRSCGNARDLGCCHLNGAPLCCCTTTVSTLADHSSLSLFVIFNESQTGEAAAWARVARTRCSAKSKSPRCFSNSPEHSAGEQRHVSIRSQARSLFRRTRGRKCTQGQISHDVNFHRDVSSFDQNARYIRSSQRGRRGVRIPDDQWQDTITVPFRGHDTPRIWRRRKPKKAKRASTPAEASDPEEASEPEQSSQPWKAPKHQKDFLKTGVAHEVVIFGPKILVNGTLPEEHGRELSAPADTSRPLP